MTPEERADFAYLLSMTQHPSVGRKRWWGLSADAMSAFALGGLFPDDWTYPRDRDDLAACYRAARRIPKHNRPRVRMILRLYRSRMAEHGCQWRTA